MSQGEPEVNTRGEISILLEGVEYVLRPSYDAIVGFEAATGKSLIELARDAGDLSVSDAAAVATECIRAWGKAIGNNAAAGVNARRVAELMIEADGGVALVLARLRVLLFGAATGGYTGAGEPKVPTTTATSAPIPDAA